MTLWLKTLCFLIITMIFIGGYTRLTDSGLSITEWKPVTGILPPLNDFTWEEEFAKYKQTPEYIQINNGMSLQEFKSIFWVEFVHRIVGRITALAYLLPFIYFLIKGYIRGRDIFTYSAGLVLLLGQGVAGWYMVKSGLAKDPNVSHFRLALHLGLAVLLYSLLFWRLVVYRQGNSSLPGGAKPYDVIARDHLGAWQSQEIRRYYSKPAEIAASSLTPRNDDPFITLLNLSLLLLFFQMIFGAFVAGLDAGLVYNQFPLMGDSLIPHEVSSNNLSLKSLSDPVFVQFMHRMIAYILAVAILVTCFFGFKVGDKLLSKILIYLLLALILQIGLGIITLIEAVPVTIALLHQLGAVLLLSLLLCAKATL